MMIPDEVLLQSDAVNDSPAHKRLLVFYIAGNPGLIGYYHEFLIQLQKNLKLSSQDRDVIIYGASSDGFELHSPPKAAKKPPYGLEEQISLTKRRIERKAIELVGPDTEAPIPVVLIAHSVGAYILLQALAWWQKRRDQQRIYQIVAGVCLFPTVVDIAMSQKGRQLSWLLGLPGISIIAQWLARFLALVPTSLWNWPQVLSPGPEHPDVTEALIRSRHGVRQTLYMANDEMTMIKENRWTDEFWGLRAVAEESANRSLASDALKPKAKLYFYWGSDDYWVDNQIRDDLIAQRASRGDAATEDFPQMRIDTHGIPHTFSLNDEHCKIVAKEVTEYICEVKDRCRKAGKLS